MGETRVDLHHLLEDRCDAYPGSLGCERWVSESGSPRWLAPMPGAGGRDSSLRALK